MTIHPYLFFDGRCEEAIEFYKKAAGAKVEMLMRFKDSPEKSPAQCAPGNEDKVMHASLRIGDAQIMCSDGHAQGKPEFKGFSLAMSVGTEAEADKLFAALGAGGQVLQPLTRTFFSPKFGMIGDKFGVMWMIMVDPQTK